MTGPDMPSRRRSLLMTALVLLTTAIAGGCIGVAFDRTILSANRAFPREIPTPPGLEQSPAMRKLFVRQLQRELDLSEAQRAQVEGLIEAQYPMMRAKLDSIRGIMRNAIKGPQTEMMRILTPEQREKFLKLVPPL
jgi:Spy/CpxP family protein refolding chaperone